MGSEVDLRPEPYWWFTSGSLFGQWVLYSYLYANHWLEVMFIFNMLLLIYMGVIISASDLGYLKEGIDEEPDGNRSTHKHCQGG
jgi:hypothetical protein